MSQGMLNNCDEVVLKNIKEKKNTASVFRESN